MYFQIKGTAGFVLPKFNNECYILIENGDHFGELDLMKIKNDNIKGVFNKEITRCFTVQAFTHCELLLLNINDINRMNSEFPEIFSEIFLNCAIRFKKAIKMKQKAIEKCE